jgi:uncharacterized protein YehS (DUF1456 family)
VTNNDVLRSIRYILNVNDARLAEVFALGGAPVPVARVEAYLLAEADEGFLACDDLTMALFLNGLVVYKRGRDDTRPAAPVDVPITNNIVLKKLRVAFELKDVDLQQLGALAGFTISKPELSAFFRSAGHKHYQACGDQFLRNFLKGLSLRSRPRS